MGGGNGSNVLLWFFGFVAFKTKINFYLSIKNKRRSILENRIFTLYLIICKFRL